MVVAGYLLGTAPTALLVARRHGRDPTREGSGNPGASNVYRTAGAKAGALVFAGDALKGVVATALGLAVDGRLLALAAGGAAVVGHVFPVMRRLRGGKGVATACGVVAVLFPLVAAVGGALWALVAKATGKASLASIVLAVLLPVGALVTDRPIAEVVGVAAIAALVVVRHASNIERLVRGDERSLHP